MSKVSLMYEWIFEGYLSPDLDFFTILRLLTVVLQCNAHSLNINNKEWGESLDQNHFCTEFAELE